MIDVAKILAPALWPPAKSAEFRAWAGPALTKGGFAGLRDSVRGFLEEKYPEDHEWAKGNPEPETAMFRFVPGQQYEFRFRNYRGEDETRHVIFQGVDYGSNSYYSTPQWFIRCWDIERGEPRSFILSNIDVETLVVVGGPAGRRAPA